VANFTTTNTTFSPKQSDKTVESIVVRLVIKDAEGNFKVTDLMLQGGTISTVWTAHPSEIRWAVDS
jgi:hypothetical protein